MKDQTKEQLREEFIESFPDLKWSTTGGTQDIADFFLSKIDTLLKSQRDDLVKKIREATGVMRTSETDKIINLIKQIN